MATSDHETWRHVEVKKGWVIGNFDGTAIDVLNRPHNWSWIELYWDELKQAGISPGPDAPDACANASCTLTNKVFVGAHVWIKELDAYQKRYFIIPFCKSCNARNGSQQHWSIAHDTYALDIGLLEDSSSGSSNSSHSSSNSVSKVPGAIHSTLAPKAPSKAPAPVAHPIPKANAPAQKPASNPAVATKAPVVLHAPPKAPVVLHNAPTKAPPVVLHNAPVATHAPVAAHPAPKASVSAPQKVLGKAAH